MSIKWFYPTKLHNNIIDCNPMKGYDCVGCVLYEGSLRVGWVINIMMNSIYHTSYMVNFYKKKYMRNIEGIYDIIVYLGLGQM